MKYRIITKKVRLPGGEIRWEVAIKYPFRFFKVWQAQGDDWSGYDRLRYLTEQDAIQAAEMVADEYLRARGFKPTKNRHTREF